MLLRDAIPKTTRGKLRALLNVSIRSKLGLAAAAFVLVMALLLVVSYFAMSTLSAVRAFVGGEGLWSKGQKDAAYRLVRYAYGQDDADYQAYRQGLRVALADRRAREELESSNADLEKSERAFIEGRNHPDDVRGMSLLFRRFRTISYLEHAIDIWEQGDVLIAELDSIATDLKARVDARALTPDDRDDFLSRIDDVNVRLTKLEDDFSFTLGQAARWLTNVLVAAMAAMTVLSIAFGVWISWLVSHGILADIQQLKAGTERLKQGDFSKPIAIESQDELGKLAVAFNDMTARLVEARTERDAANASLSLRASELEDANKRLTEHEKIKSEFFSNISHELRTPLSLIVAPLESLLDGEYGPSPEAWKSPLGTIHNNAIRLLQMVQGLLDFQKLEAHRVEVHREPTRIVALTRSLVEDFQPIMKQRRLACVLSLPEKDSLVSVDRYLYERIAFNLLSNAVKFTPRDGTITVSLALDGDSTVLTVRDTGIGIDPADQPFLFERFRQVEGASTRRFEGAGLGLALVKEFAELLGGNVVVQSRKEEGSTFTVRIATPAADARTVQAVRERIASTRIEQFAHGGTTSETSDQTLREGEARHPVEGDPPLDAHVLIVEDNIELAEYIASLLGRLCKVTILRDGEEALARVGALAPTMIISDVMMPKIDGYTLCRELKKRPETREIPFVLLTALTYRDALIKGWQAGADDYLFKPFNPVELVARVNALLSTNRRMRELIDSRKRTQGELLDRERDIATTLDSIRDGVIATDTDKKIVRMNPVAEELTGWAAKDAIGKPLHEVLTILPRSHAAPTRRTEPTIHRMLVSRDGTERNISDKTSPIRDSSDRFMGEVVVLRDVTEERQTESRLREAAEQLAEAQAIAGLGSWEWNIEADVVTWSDELFRLFGLQRGTDTLSYKAYLERLPDSERDRVNATIADALEKKASFEVEHSVRLPNGDLRWIHARGRVITNAESAAVRMVGTAHDVTERRAAESARLRLAEERTAKELAQQALEQRDTFLSIASHELRTPLTPLHLQLDMLRRGLMTGATSEKLLQKAEAATRQVDRLTRLVDGLLDVAKIRAGRLLLSAEPFDLAQLARQVAEDFSNDTKNQRVSIRVDAPGAVEGVWDRARIEQVLVNLVSNAKKYGQGTPIEIAVRQEGDTAKLTVKDHGIGIPADKLERIFDRFERTEGALASSGLGLGLYITRELVEAHNGRVWASSDPLSGTIFTVVLPVASSYDTGVQLTGGR